MTATTSISTARGGERPWWLTLINGLLAVVIGGVLDIVAIFVDRSR